MTDKVNKFDPSKSAFHEIILKKYIRKGYSREQAYKAAKAEFEISVKTTNFWS